MFTKNLILSAVIVLMPTLASASPYPWKKPAKGITQTHKSMAKELNKSLNKTGIVYPLAIHPFNANWGKKRRFEAISNVEIKNLQMLFEGHYFVSTYKPWANRTDSKGDLLTIRYFGADGKLYGCTARSSKNYAEVVVDWKVHQAYAGYGGISSYDRPLYDDALGYSFVYENDTGRALYYKHASSRSRHEVFIGHFQKEYAPVFAEICPNLPKVGRVNEAQTSRKYSEFFKQGAKPIKGIPVVFKQDVDDPLTLEKYFTLYPPTAK